MGNLERSPTASPAFESRGASRPAKKEAYVKYDTESVHEINRYPLLNKVQEQYLFRAIKEGKGIKDISTDPEFTRTIVPQDEEKFWDTFLESDSVKEVVAKCNLRLVASVARTYGVLSFQERFKKGILD